MTIVLYDTEHFETLETQVRLLHTGMHRIVVLAPEALQVKLVASGIIPGPRIHFRTLPVRSWEQPGAVYRTCKAEGAALLILATVSFQHLLFARTVRRLRPLRVLLGVHDVHELFAPARRGGLRGLLHYLGRQQLVAAASGYIVLLDEMKTLLRRTYSVRKPVHVVPGSLHRPSVERELTEVLQIVVPGSIDAKRRRYSDVQQLARALFPGAPVTITVVGSNPEGASPSWFDAFPGTLAVRTGAFVEVDFYEQAVADADIVLAPLPALFQRPGQPDEHYGQSKSSGSFFDALRHGKPLLVPDGVAVPELLAPITLTYIDTEHLAYLVLALQQNVAARARLAALARAVAAPLTPEALRPRLLPALTGSP